MDDFDKLIKRVGNLSASGRIGALEPEAAQKLAYAEFGTRTAPARPILSSTTDQSAQAIRRVMESKIDKVFEGKDQDGESILGDVLSDLQEIIVERLRGGFGRKLKKSTIKGRKSRGNTDTRPLIDPTLLKGGDKSLLREIDFEVESGSQGWNSEDPTSLD